MLNSCGLLINTMYLQKILFKKFIISHFIIGSFSNCCRYFRKLLLFPRCENDVSSYWNKRADWIWNFHPSRLDCRILHKFDIIAKYMTALRYYAFLKIFITYLTFWCIFMSMHFSTSKWYFEKQARFSSGSYRWDHKNSACV